MILAELFSQAGDTKDEWVLFVDTSSHDGQMLAFNKSLEPLYDLRWGKESRHDKVINFNFSKITQNLEIKHLKAIVCVQGPGSFTGLRVSAVFAKTLSLALKGLPIFGVSSFIVPALSILEHDLIDLGSNFSVQIPSIQEMTFLATFEFEKKTQCYTEMIDRTNAKIRDTKLKHEFILSKKNTESNAALKTVPRDYHDFSLSLFKESCSFSYHNDKSSYLDFYPLFLRRSEAEEKFNYDKKAQQTHSFKE